VSVLAAVVFLALLAVPAAIRLVASASDEAGVALSRSAALERYGFAFD